VIEPFTAICFKVLYGSDSVNITCCWENFILVHIGSVLYIILIKCCRVREVKSTLWLQCEELPKSEIMSRVKVCQCHLVNKILKNVYEKCRLCSEVKCSHHSKVLALCHVLNKLSNVMVLKCDISNRVSELCYVCRSVC